MTERMLKAVLCALAAMNVADYLFTLRAIYVMGVPEANPLMDLTLGTPLFGLIKCIIIPAACWMLWRARHHWWRPAIVGLLLFVTVAYSGVTVWHVWGQLAV